MNRYQKVITCIIRCVSVALLFYGLNLALVSVLMPGRAWKLSLIFFAPAAVFGLLLYFGAIPLARLITWKVRDD